MLKMEEELPHKEKRVVSEIEGTDACTPSSVHEISPRLAISEECEEVEEEISEDKLEEISKDLDTEKEQTSSTQESGRPPAPLSEIIEVTTGVKKQIITAGHGDVKPEQHATCFGSA